MIVKSMTELSDFEKRNIQRIASESKCINESLRATFGAGFHRYDETNDTAYFGAHSYDYTYEIIPVVK